MKPVSHQAFHGGEMTEAQELIERSKAFNWLSILGQAIKETFSSHPHTAAFYQTLIERHNQQTFLTLLQQHEALRTMRERGILRWFDWTELERYARDLADWQSSRLHEPTSVKKSTSDLTGPERQGHSALEEQKGS